jgi:tetratricopeptide (TPR) repeat protein
MRSSQRPLQHLSFFEALASMQEDSPDWRAASAGLVTLRLFDAWVEEGPSVVASDAWGLRAVREAIAAVDRRSTHRALLTSVVDAMTAAPVVRIATVAPRLMAYARVLQLDARWQLASDVYRTVIAHAHPVEDADVVVTSNMQLGACLRMMADWSEAALAYSTAGQIAALTGDIMNVLRSRVSEANISIDRGNLPQAEAILEETIARAREARQAETTALALHARAHVASLRQDYELAIRLAYEALEGTREPTARDRILADIATAFSDLGVRSAARDAYLIIAATAQEQYLRWAATINLMELAAQDRIEPVFEQYRREVGGAAGALPPAMAAYYFYAVGQGYRMFNRPELARPSLERAIEIAAAHQINQLLFEAESCLSGLRAGSRVSAPPAREASEASEETREVAGALHRMRRMAGVAG